MQGLRIDDLDPASRTLRRQVLAGIFVVGVGMALLTGLAVGLDASVVAVALAMTPFALLLMNYPFAAVLVWVLIMPFFVHGGVEAAAAANWILHRALLPGLLLTVVIYHLLGIRRSSFRLHLYDLAIVAFLGIGVVNVFAMSPNPERIIAAYFDKIVVPIALFWYVRSIGLRPDDLRRLLVVGVITILVQSVIGLVSWLEPSLLPAAWLVRAGDRTAGTFGGPAPFTITLMLFALLSIHFAAQAASRARTAFLLGVVAVAFAGVLFSLSRGSWLGAAAGTAGLVFLYPRVIAPVAMAGVAVIGLLAIGPLQEQVATAAVRLETQSTIDDRVVTNDASIRMIGDRPLDGFGFQNFERFDERYKQRVGDIPLKIGGSSHNTYLNMAVEMGLPALVLYFAPVLALLAGSMRLRRWLPSRGAISWPLVVVLWLALLDQFLVSNFLEMIHAYVWGTSVWWLTLGLIAVVLDQAQARLPVGAPADRAERW